MNRTAALRAAALAAAVAFAAPHAAHAQFGGALRGLGRRAAQAVGTQATTAVASQTPGNPAFSQNVVEITPAVLDGFARSLATEDSLRSGTADRSSPAYRERYRVCEERLAQTDAHYRELRDAAVNAPHPDAEKRYLELDAYRYPRCGHEPELGNPEIVAIAGAAGGLTGRQYAIVKERVAPFCEHNGATGNYVYSAGEFSALKPRCAALKPAIQAVL